MFLVVAKLDHAAHSDIDPLKVHFIPLYGTAPCHDFKRFINWEKIAPKSHLLNPEARKFNNKYVTVYVNL